MRGMTKFIPYDIIFDFLIVQELCILYIRNWNQLIIFNKYAYERHALSLF